MMPSRENERLYRQLKNRICERIYRGDYRDGEKLPPERALAESLGISRVTVRKALGELAADGVITRVQGSGNRVSLSLAGTPGTMDIIAVLAHAQNAFFAAFIERLQRTAEECDTLVLFKQAPAGEMLEESLFKLHQKDIRNAVIWLEDSPVDMEAIRRLRGLGMNMVFFDDVTPSPYADGVLLDNDEAIGALCRALEDQGAERLAYVGWDSAAVQSACEREGVFRRRRPGARLFRIPWRERGKLGPAAGEVVSALVSAEDRPQAIVCGDGEIGVAIRAALLAAGHREIAVASPDEYPQSRALDITVYRQDFAQLAAATYRCLCRQNQPGWAASTYRIKGELLGSGEASQARPATSPSIATWLRPPALAR